MKANWMDFRPAGEEQVTAKTMDAVREAVRYNWTLDQLIAAVEQSWISVHGDHLQDAKWEVSVRHKVQP